MRDWPYGRPVAADEADAERYGVHVGDLIVRIGPPNPWTRPLSDAPSDTWTGRAVIWCGRDGYIYNRRVIDGPVLGAQLRDANGNRRLSEAQDTTELVAIVDEETWWRHRFDGTKPTNAETTWVSASALFLAESEKV